MEEKRKVKELKQKMIEANSIREVRYFEKEIHLVLDIAEKRYIKPGSRDRVPSLTD
jgi:hypothetical protein